MLTQEIIRNRKREALMNRTERILRAVRLRVFDYADAGKADKAARIIDRCKARLSARWKARADNLACARHAASPDNY